MGLPMASNLQRHLASIGGPPLGYFNRTISRGDSLKSLGGVPASKPSELVSQSDIIFMSLSDDAALESTVDLILESDNLQGKIIADSSTVHPDSSAKAQSRLAQKGARFIASPVFGASPVAAQGKVLWVVAGQSEAVDAIVPYLGAMGRDYIRLGEDVRQSGLMKTTGNFITAGMMEVVAEAHVLAEKTGLGSTALEALIEQQYGPLALSMSQRLTKGAYIPAPGDRPFSDLQLALKDVGHGITCAEQAGTRLEVAEVALGHLKEAGEFAEREGRLLDSSSMYGVLRVRAGLDFETEHVKERDGNGSVKQ